MEEAGSFLPVLFFFFFSGHWLGTNLVAWGRYCGGG